MTLLQKNLKQLFPLEIGLLRLLNAIRSGLPQLPKEWGCLGQSGLGVPRPPKNADFWVLLHFYVTIFRKLGVHEHPRNPGCGTPVYVCMYCTILDIMKY